MNSEKSARRLLVLGLGNDILTDDAVGLRAVRWLRHQFAEELSIAFQETSEMGLALLDHIIGFDTVIIIDAIQTGKAAPGTLHEIEASELSKAAGAAPHLLGVPETLALAKELHLPIPSRVHIYAIEAADPYTLGISMTPELEAALPEIVRRIAAAIEPLASMTPPAVQTSTNAPEKNSRPGAQPGKMAA
jgi:hydrogenase maturation protease